MCQTIFTLIINLFISFSLIEPSFGGKNNAGKGEKTEDFYNLRSRKVPLQSITSSLTKEKKTQGNKKRKPSPVQNEHGNKKAKISNESGEEKYDYIVIGAGSSGSAVVGSLLRLFDKRKGIQNSNDSIKILLLEAGEKNEDEKIQTYEKSGELTFTKYDWRDVTTPQDHLNSRAIAYNTGKVNGGGSCINGMLCARGHKEDYNDWTKDEGEEDQEYWKEWRGDAVYKLFDTFENLKKPGRGPTPSLAPQAEESKEETKEVDPLHGLVPITKLTNRLADDFMKFAKDFTNDNNGNKYHPEEKEIDNYAKNPKQGVYYPRFNIERNGNPQIKDNEGVGLYDRRDAFTCFVSLFKDDSRLQIKNNARVCRIIFDKTKNATGVEYSYSDSKGLSYKYDELNEGGEIILSAGAIRSPQILMLSGIGNKDDLEKMNIKSVHDLKGVGTNLQDHISTAIVRRISPGKKGSVYQPGLKFKSFSLGSSPLTSHELRTPHKHLNTTAINILFTPKNSEGHQKEEENNNERPMYQIQSFCVGAYDNSDDGYFGAAVVHLRPRSTGIVKLASKDPLDEPLINPKYFSDLEGKDMANHMAALREAQKLIGGFSGPEFGWLEKEEIYPGEDISKDDERLKKYIREWSVPYMHPIGTCKMGNRKDPKAVVGYHLKVNGVTGLRVADASIMPSLPSANTNGTAMMIGVQCARFIAKEKGWLKDKSH